MALMKRKSVAANHSWNLGHNQACIVKSLKFICLTVRYTCMCSGNEFFHASLFIWKEDVLRWQSAIMLRAMPIMDAGQTESAVLTFPPFFRMSPDNWSIALSRRSVAALPFSAVVEKCSSMCGLLSEGCMLLLT